jgi:hypothetical protein
MFDVLGVPGNEVIHADHLMTLLDEPVAEVRTKKSGTAGNECSGHGGGEKSWIVNEGPERFGYWVLGTGYSGG